MYIVCTASMYVFNHVFHICTQLGGGNLGRCPLPSNIFVPFAPPQDFFKKQMFLKGLRSYLIKQLEYF